MSIARQAIQSSGAPQDTFLSGFIGSQALAVALDRGLIDRLAESPLPLGHISNVMGLNTQGIEILVSVLLSEGVLGETPSGEIALTAPFRSVLARRDILEAKLKFLRLAARDILDYLPDLLFDLPKFMANAGTFRLFRYDKCLEVTADNIAFTRQWVDYTTVLTRYEAEVVLPHLNLGGRKRLLDIGGNSGEFALRLCRRFSDLHATVVDLPVVCVIGEDNVQGRPGADRVRFVAGDARRDRLPGGHDVVVFKSVLHDWPDGDVMVLLEAALAALEPGGQLVIFERGRIETGCGGLPYSMAANLVFAPFFRDAQFYVAALQRLGLAAVTVERVTIEMPFHLVTADKPS